MAAKAKEPVAYKYALTAASAVLSETATYPLDMTKTRLQLQGELTREGSRKGALAMLAHIYSTEGARGVYRGLAPAVTRHCVYTSIRIGTYEQLRNALVQEGSGGVVPLWQKMFIGATSGVIGQVVASPTDLVKVRMQADGVRVALGHQRRYTGMVHAFTSIVREGGVAALWRGWGPNAQRAAMVNLGELAFYDQTKQWTLARGLQDNIYAHTFAAIGSGFWATLFSCPADVVKTRIMNMHESGVQYKSSLDCLMRTVKAEGILGLYKGFFPTWARLGPWQFVFWISYEQLRKVAGLSSF